VKNIPLQNLSKVLLLGRGAPDPDPAGSEVGSSKYWPDPHNYDIKHLSIFSFQEMIHNNRELYTIEKLTESFQFNTVNVRH